jgi:hypothetical protein
MKCPYCEEYDVNHIPEGNGGLGNICTDCTEYTIPTVNNTGDLYWLPDPPLKEKKNEDRKPEA